MAEDWPWLAEQLDGLRAARPFAKSPAGANARRAAGAKSVSADCGTSPRTIISIWPTIRDSPKPREMQWPKPASGRRRVRLVSGRSPFHEALEHRLAEFERQESAVLFPTGYAANVGTIAALVDERDVIFCDRLNHASLIDGCRLSGAKLLVYRHDRLDKLKSALQRGKDYQRRWIVTDSLFSMDGDAAPLPELADLADEFDARLIVDEAHATGVFGEHGRGIAEWQGVEDRIAVRIGTLSKALGTLGGFVSGTQDLMRLALEQGPLANVFNRPAAGHLRGGVPGRGFDRSKNLGGASIS